MICNNNISNEFEQFNNENLPNFILTPNGRILKLNEQAVNLLGQGFVEGQTIRVDKLKNWIRFVQNAKKSYSPIKESFGIRSESGTYNILKVEGLYREKDNAIILRVLSSETVFSETEHRESSKFSYQKVLKYIPKGVIITDQQGIIVEVNDHALLLMNCKKNEVLYKNHEVLFDNMEKDEESMQQYYEKVSNNGSANLNLSYQASNNLKVDLKFESVRIPEGNYLITSISDETEKKLLQSKIDQYDSLNIIGQMAASIAHEIRNPMTSLMGFTELLKIEASDEAFGYLSIIESELQRMEHILNELLHLSKPRERKKERVNLNTLLEDVVNLMLPQASMHASVIQLVEPMLKKVDINGCLMSLKQVLINIIKNALESMPNGGTVDVHLKVNDKEVEIHIVDEGVGISEENLDKIFIPFQTTKNYGTGLGLPYVKEIIEEHGGIIEVKSKENAGTTFILKFPLKL